MKSPSPDRWKVSSAVMQVRSAKEAVSKTFAEANMLGVLPGVVDLRLHAIPSPAARKPLSQAIQQLSVFILRPSLSPFPHCSHTKMPFMLTGTSILYDASCAATCLQLKEDTIALAAGAVTAMLAANAAAAGPMDSPEKVCSSQGSATHVGW